MWVHFDNISFDAMCSFSCQLGALLQSDKESFTVNVRADIFSTRGGVLRFSKNGRTFHFGSVFERTFSFEGWRGKKSQISKCLTEINCA